ncbi:Uncharacterised protein [Enterococcus faecium]|mgnify:CR=1 FL=1|uniref:Mobilization protein n=17 Tax=cellular organisms TaxID=131567 RepID=A0JBR8_ENTFC|nr:MULTISPECIES: hypothetical protein [Bacteria]ARJ34063.1 hypothetical protein [Enterococcus faecium]ARJ34130.1 hypothetical protein [Enterococcus faecium]ARJ34183.1 hypothetical protein [Enterococcus faecium]MCE3150575.1 hypothetical protein [Enterococcus faecium]MCF4770788.1 hypothetical protein [Acinetobacter baumannii]
MSWTDENEPTINNEPTSYEELELAFAKLQKKYEENNELLRLNNRKLDRLEETMTNTLKEEQTTNKNYRSKTLQDIENEIKKQRAFLAPYTKERIQTTIDSQVKKFHHALLNQRNKEQKKVIMQRSMDILAPLCCLIMTLLAFWLVWGE